MNLFPFLVVWILLAVTILAMLVWRKSIARNEDEFLHLPDAASGQRSLQASVAHKLEVIDKWGKVLTVFAVVFGLILGVLYVYQGWVSRTTLGA